MAIVLYVRNRNAKNIKKIGLITTDDFEKIIEIAAHFNLNCLSFVDFIGDTIFNQKQILELLKEIDFLKKQKTEIKVEYLDILHAAALAALECPDCYLLINGE